MVDGAPCSSRRTRDRQRPSGLPSGPCGDDHSFWYSTRVFRCARVSYNVMPDLLFPRTPVSHVPQAAGPGTLLRCFAAMACLFNTYSPNFLVRDFEWPLCRRPLVLAPETGVSLRWRVIRRHARPLEPEWPLCRGPFVLGLAHAVSLRWRVLTRNARSFCPESEWPFCRRPLVLGPENRCFAARACPRRHARPLLLRT
jgi:hypothetical protein